MGWVLGYRAISDIRPRDSLGRPNREMSESITSTYPTNAVLEGTWRVRPPSFGCAECVRTVDTNVERILSRLPFGDRGRIAHGRTRGVTQWPAEDETETPTLSSIPTGHVTSEFAGAGETDAVAERHIRMLDEQYGSEPPR